MNNIMINKALNKMISNIKEAKIRVLKNGLIIDRNKKKWNNITVRDWWYYVSK